MSNIPFLMPCQIPRLHCKAALCTLLVLRIVLKNSGGNPSTLCTANFRSSARYLWRV